MPLEIMMRPNKLLLRCYAERDGDVWMAVSLDFSLVAQGATLEDARNKLDAQILDYLVDALDGPDRPHAEVLLTRRAPLVYWLKYGYARVLTAVLRRAAVGRSRHAQSFRESVPMVPANC